MKLKEIKIGICIPKFQLNNSSMSSSSPLTPVDDLLKEGAQISIITYSSLNLEDLILNNHLLYNDILVLFSPPEELLKSLVEKKKQISTLNIPLVLLMETKLSQASLYLSYLSRLLRRDGIFFVPFSIAPKSFNEIIIYCRKDLLTKTCSLALNGKQIRPAVFETHSNMCKFKYRKS